MNTKHIHEVEVGDKITAYRNTTFDETFHVESISRRADGIPLYVRGAGGKGIVTGLADDSLITLARQEDDS